MSNIIDICDACGGTGVDQAEDMTACTWCDGKGKILIKDEYDEGSTESEGVAK